MQVDQIFDEQPIAGVLRVVLSSESERRTPYRGAGSSSPTSGGATKDPSQILWQHWAVGFDNRAFHIGSFSEKRVSRLLGNSLQIEAIGTKVSVWSKDIRSINKAKVVMCRATRGIHHEIQGRCDLRLKTMPLFWEPSGVCSTCCRHVAVAGSHHGSVNSPPVPDSF